MTEYTDVFGKINKNMDNALKNKNDIRNRYAWSPAGLDVPVSVYDAVANSTCYYHTDANKNITELTNASGSVVAHYEYSPFGKVVVSAGAYANNNPFRFSSEYHDDETGLVYYNYRYYSPELGRQLSKDPIKEERTNLYSICDNDNVIIWDNLGLFSFDDVAQSAKSFLDTRISGVGGFSYTKPTPKFPIWSHPVVFLQANVTFAGDAFICQKFNKQVLALRQTISVEGYVSMGFSLTKGNPGKGRVRNEKIPNPNNPRQLIKRKKANTPPESGYRERNRYVELNIGEDKCCPNEQVSFAGGNLFLRGSAGVGLGYQMNFQKRIDSTFTDLSQGWSFSAGRAWGVTGLSIDAGISVSGQIVKYLKQW